MAIVAKTDSPNLQSFKHAVTWLATAGGFTWEQVAEGMRMTEAEQRAILFGFKEAPPETQWRPHLTLMVQRRAALCEEYLNSRGIVTGWQIWPTRWARDAVASTTERAFVAARDRERNGFWARLRGAVSLLRGEAPAHG